MAYLRVFLFLCSYCLAVDPALEPKLADDGYEEKDWTIHDPSRVIVVENGSRHMIAATGKAQDGGYDCGLETYWREADGGGDWRPGQCLYTTKPSWVSEVAPDQDGAYWAPELINKNVLIWSFSEGFNAAEPVTCVGVATSTGELNEMTWTDAGKPMFCIDQKDYDEERSAIDPSVFTGFDGKIYLVTGGGYIIGTELDSTTYMPKSGTGFTLTDSSWYELARGPLTEDDEYGWVEAAYVWPKEVDGVQLYFMFVNWGSCCNGIDSTYEIRVGRSTNPMGPYVDKTGLDMTQNGGTMFLDAGDYMFGPGHAATSERDGDTIISFHYYDARRSGSSWIAERELYIENGWPVAGELLSSYEPLCTEPTGKVKLVFGRKKKKKTCTWFFNHKKFNCDKTQVQDACPVSCGLCEAQPCKDPTGKVELFFGQKRKFQTCEWFSNHKKFNCNKTQVKEACPDSCNTCS